MKILHTADWHLGQLFHQYDRTYEHSQFLDWLVETLHSEKIDVLLISGDVFDVANPSAVSVKLFYSFLTQATRKCPDLQIIVTAGNHDSASRLESPKPLLESSNIHIIGLIHKQENKAIDYAGITIPLKKDGLIKAWCLAVPFLRIGDYPDLPEAKNSYSEGVCAFYKEATDHVKTIIEPGQALVAMGHLHAQQAEVGDIDTAERPIMGGVECISVSAFDDSIAYVALGHIHKAQKIGGKEHIRYSGSPLPMSFTEIRYTHQVLVFNIEADKVTNIQSLPVPVSVPLIRVPEKHAPIAEVLIELEKLDTQKNEHPPYLEVRVLCEGPEPGLRHKIETVLSDKHVLFTKIDVTYNKSNNNNGESAGGGPEKLDEIQPDELLERVYQKKYNNPVSDELKNLFRLAVEEVHQQEN